jgi:hypothetical protein
MTTAWPWRTRRLLAAWDRLHEAHGGTLKFGRRVPRLAAQAGLLVDEVRLCAHSSVRLGLGPMFDFFKSTLPLLVDGSRHGLSRRQAGTIARSFDRYAEEHGAECCVIFPKVIVQATIPS